MSARNSFSIRRRLFRPLVAVSLLMSGLALGVASPASAAAAPFSCQPGFYQVVSGQLKVLDSVTGKYTDIGPKHSIYNAMGYNVQDNYIYAMSTAPSTLAHLLKIAGDGTVTDLGQPTNIPADNYIAADMDGKGHLIVRDNATTWYSVDIATVVATPLTITGPNQGAEVVLIDGVSYAVDGQTLYRTNIATRTATSVAVSGFGTDTGTWGAGWTDKDGELFFSNNDTGHIYKLNNFKSASASATLANQGTITSSNDGTSCPLAASGIAAPIAVNDTYNAKSGVTLSVPADGVLTNDSGSILRAALASPPTHGTVTLNRDGSFTYISSAGFVGDDTYTYTATDYAGRIATATVTVHVTAPDTTQATITGSVEVDGTDSGIADVTVDLLKSDGTRVASAVTDDDGIYVFENVAPGSYVVAVRTETLPADSIETSDPDSVLDNKTAVTVAADDIDLDPFAYANVLAESVDRPVIVNGSEVVNENELAMTGSDSMQLSGLALFLIGSGLSLLVLGRRVSAPIGRHFRSN